MKFKVVILNFRFFLMLIFSEALPENVVAVLTRKGLSFIFRFQNVTCRFLGRVTKFLNFFWWFRSYALKAAEGVNPPLVLIGLMIFLIAAE